MSTLHVDTVRYFDDNFSYLITQGNGKPTAIVDCGDSGPVLDHLESSSMKPDFLLLTHSHYDHAGDIAGLLEVYPKLTVVKPAEEARITQAAIEIADQEEIEFGDFTIGAIQVPAHTLYCTSYLIGDSLFVGDALFSGGCGRIFEGTPEKLEKAMDRLSAFPNETKVYFGHEYTLANLRFAKSIEPGNADIQSYMKEVEEKLGRGEYSTPSTIGLEKRINPFFRIDEETVVESIDPEKALTRTKRMELLRKKKDNF